MFWGIAISGAGPQTPILVSPFHPTAIVLCPRLRIRSPPAHPRPSHPARPSPALAPVPQPCDPHPLTPPKANRFIDTARRSSHRPESHEQELEMVIYNYKPWWAARWARWARCAVHAE